jgi:hypothetical protein
MEVLQSTSTVEKQLSSLLLLFIEWEKALIRQRTSLSECPDFNPVRAFSNLDRSRSGYLTESDIVSFLGEHDSLASETDV